MFYVNGEQLKLDSPQGERFLKWKKEVLSDLKDPVVLKSGKPIKFNFTGLVEPPKSEYIPFRVTIGTDYGTETWVYSSVLPIKKKDELIFPERGRIFKHGRSWRLNKNTESELIYFMLELSSFVKKGRIILVDKERDARKRLEKEVAAVDVKWYVSSVHSPISVESTGGENTLRLIASAWGVEKVEEKGISEVKLDLISAVEKSQGNYGVTRRGFKEFLNENKIDDLLQLRATIQRALDKGVIKFKEDDMTCRFKSTDYTLMSVPHRDWAVRDAALFNYLRIRSDLAEKLYEEMGDKVQLAKAEGVKIPEKMGIEGMAELRKVAKSLGINTYGMKKYDIIAEISKTKEKVF